MDAANSMKLAVGTIFLYLPNAILFFGFMSDVVNQEINRSIASIAGLLGVFSTYLLGKIRLPTRTSVTTATSASTVPAPNPFDQVAPTSNNPFDAFGGKRNMKGGANPFFCSIPGLSGFESQIAPQNLIMTVSILFYYMLSEWINNPSQSISLSVTSGIIILLQVISLVMNDCLRAFKFSEVSVAIPLVLAIVLGVGYGGIVYALYTKLILPKIEEDLARRSAPVSSSSGPDTFVCPPGYIRIKGVCKKTKDGTEISIGQSGQQVSADLDDGDYELVGELFKDGELITSSIVD